MLIQAGPTEDGCAVTRSCCWEATVDRNFLLCNFLCETTLLPFRVPAFRLSQLPQPKTIFEFSRHLPGIQVHYWIAKFFRLSQHFSGEIDSPLVKQTAWNRMRHHAWSLHSGSFQQPGRTAAPQQRLHTCQAHDRPAKPTPRSGRTISTRAAVYRSCQCDTKTQLRILNSYKILKYTMF